MSPRRRAADRRKSLAGSTLTLDVAVARAVQDVGLTLSRRSKPPRSSRLRFGSGRPVRPPAAGIRGRRCPFRPGLAGAERLDRWAGARHACRLFITTAQRRGGPTWKWSSAPPRTRQEVGCRRHRRTHAAPARVRRAAGSSPLIIYDELGRRVAQGSLSLAKVRAFMLDEYVGLPADHPQRYRNVIKLSSSTRSISIRLRYLGRTDWPRTWRALARRTSEP